MRAKDTADTEQYSKGDSEPNQSPFAPAAGFLTVVAEQTNREWLADYDLGAVEREQREREARAESFKWYHLMRRTILDNHAEKHVLRCLADHAHAGPDSPLRSGGECVVLRRTIVEETGLSLTVVKEALAGLAAKDIIVRESRGRRGGGRGANRYRMLPSNPYEREQRAGIRPNKGPVFGRHRERPSTSQ